VKLIQGDCLEAMKSIPDGSVDMILTDPPYGTTACKWDSVIPFEPMWEQLKRVIKPHGAICLFGSEPFSSGLRMSNIKQFKYDWIWEKEQSASPLNCKFQPMKVHEMLSVFSKSASTYSKKGSMYYDAQMTEGTVYTTNNNKDGSFTFHGKISHNRKKQKVSLRYPRSVVKFSRERGFHPTQKPVALLEYLIKTYTATSQTVLDFTMGSGSTGVAAVNLHRNFIGMELDSTYFKIAQDRIEEAKHNIQLQLF